MEKSAVKQAADALRLWSNAWNEFDKTGKNKPAPIEEVIEPFIQMEEDEKHKAYLYGHKVGFMKAKKPIPIVENKTKNCKKEYNGKGRQAPPPPLHSKTRTK